MVPGASVAKAVEALPLYDIYGIGNFSLTEKGLGFESHFFGEKQNLFVIVLHGG